MTLARSFAIWFQALVRARPLLLAVSCTAVSLVHCSSPAPEPNSEPEAAGADVTLADIGKEVAVARHLAEGEEFTISLAALLKHGKTLFSANWTEEEGAGRPLSKGTGASLSDPSAPLLFPRNFNRVSGPDANSCAGCHNAPFGVPGGGGDVVGNVFILGNRFDFVTFDAQDSLPTRGGRDERGMPQTAASVGNSRATVGMFGSGFIEMLARQMTLELQSIRNRMRPGDSAVLHAKGIYFGALRRRADATWDTSRVTGLTPASLASQARWDRPTLVVRPFHQSSSVVSLRQFTVSAFNEHHGIQAEERFGSNEDDDGDGFVNELTPADVTAVTLYQATMAVPGRVIPRNAVIERAITRGEELFADIGCANCHTPSLPLADEGWVFIEPNPFNPPDYLHTHKLHVDLTSEALPLPRLRVENGVVNVPAYTDLKLHDITSGPADPNREPLDMNSKPGSEAFNAGNARFITKKLWGAANEPPYFHHGQFTTLRQAVLAHAGEAAAVTDAFRKLSSDDRNCVIEFLKSLRVLPPGSASLVVDEHGNPR
jgi:Di-haem oxidoreductase, putative peroxidase